MDRFEWNQKISNDIHQIVKIDQKEIRKLYIGRCPENLMKIKIAHIPYIHKIVCAIVSTQRGHKELGDLLGHAYLLLDEAVERYSPFHKKAIPFKNFLSCMVNNRMWDYLRHDTVIPSPAYSKKGYIETKSYDQIISSPGSKLKIEASFKCPMPSPDTQCMDNDERAILAKTVKKSINYVLQPGVLKNFKKKFRNKNERDITRDDLEVIVKKLLQGNTWRSIGLEYGLPYNEIRRLFQNIYIRIEYFAKREKGKKL